MMLTFRPFYILATILVVVGLVIRPVALADTTGPIVINEIMWAGTEYVELFNNGGSAVDLSNWHLIRQAADGSATNDKKIEVGKHIAGGGFFLLTSSGGDTTLSPVNLVDGGELLVLKDATGQVIDTANQQGAWFAGKNPSSGDAGDMAMERNSPGDAGTLAGSWHDSAGIFGSRFGTPGAGNSAVATPTPSPTPTPTPTPIVYSNAVVVNEFLPNPVGTDTDNEFMELKNTGDVAVDLAGWQLDDVDGAGSSSPYTFPSGSSIVGHGFLVVFNNTSHITLNNDGDSARLIAPDGAVKSSASYAVSVGEGLSFNLLTDASYGLSTTLTPGAENVITVATAPVASVEPDAVYARTIKINEVLPDPAGSDSAGEYIEVKNTGSDAISLSGWQLDDGAGGSSPFTLSAVSLAAGEIKYFLSSVTHLSLTNSGDTARILDPNGETADFFSYTGSQEGVSWNRLDDGSFVESTTLTPGAANIITAPEDSSGKATSSSSSKKTATSKTTASGKVAGANVTVVDLEKVRGLKDGTMVTTEGVVSAPPNVVGANILYIAGSGIRVVLPKTFTQKLAVGDVVRITGQLGTSYTERRILVQAKTGSVAKVKVGTAPVPHEVKTGEIGSIWEGSLVHVNGIISKLEGATLYIDDGSGEVKIVIAEATKITRPKLKRGVAADVVGVVSRTSSGYRVLPRFQTDVNFGSAATALKVAKVSKPKAVAKPKGRISAEAATTCAPWPSNSPTAEPAACKGVTVVSKQLDNRWVFLGCLLAMVLLVRGFQRGEPLLSLTGRRS